jgi:hypothetical protein
MKIIGERPGATRSAEKTLILEATEKEVARLLGHYFVETNELRDQLKPGAEILVSKMYERLYALAQNKALPSAVASLRGLADLLETQNPIISAAVSEEAE